jgi:hypothetical protein
MAITQGGAVLQTNFIWDVQQIQQVDVNSQEFKELLIRLYQNLNLMANVINAKDTAIYSLQPVIASNSWFANPANNSSTAAVADDRTEIRQTYLFALPTGTTTIPHGITITKNTTFTFINGAANDTTGFNYYPLPWPSASGTTNISVVLNATNIVITNNSGISFNVCYLVVKFLQT